MFFSFFLSFHFKNWCWIDLFLSLVPQTLLPQKKKRQPKNDTSAFFELKSHWTKKKKKKCILIFIWGMCRVLTINIAFFPLCFLMSSLSSPLGSFFPEPPFPSFLSPLQMKKPACTIFFPFLSFPLFSQRKKKQRNKKTKKQKNKKTKKQKKNKKTKKQKKNKKTKKKQKNKKKTKNMHNILRRCTGPVEKEKKRK